MGHVHVIWPQIAEQGGKCILNSPGGYGKLWSHWMPYPGISHPGKLLGSFPARPPMLQKGGGLTLLWSSRWLQMILPRLKGRKLGRSQRKVS